MKFGNYYSFCISGFRDQLSVNANLHTNVVLFFFPFFSKTLAGARLKKAIACAECEKEKQRTVFSFPHPYPTSLVVNKSPAVFVLLSRALD